MPVDVTFTFPMPLEPEHRHMFLEDPLTAFLEENNLGEWVGGGTFLGDGNAISGCDISVTLNDLDSLERVTAKLNELGAAKGSTFELDDEDAEPQAFGSNESLALFLDMDLPDEVMEHNDIGKLYQAIEHSISGAGQWLGSSQQGRHYVLYLYGPSFAALEQCLAPLLEQEPLLENAFVRQVA